MPLAETLCDTTLRRIINDEPVPSTEKVRSIFEDHTDVIRNDRRETIYGHKICLTGGALSLILDCVVLEGKPADATLAVDAVKRQEDVWGRYLGRSLLTVALLRRGTLQISKTWAYRM